MADSRSLTSFVVDAQADSRRQSAAIRYLFVMTPPLVDYSPKIPRERLINESGDCIKQGKITVIGKGSRKTGKDNGFCSSRGNYGLRFQYLVSLKFEVIECLLGLNDGLRWLAASLDFVTLHHNLPFLRIDEPDVRFTETLQNP
jgi:hypothetical protein